MEISSSTVFSHVQPGQKPPTEPYDVLSAILTDSIAYSGKRARWFSILYYGLRTMLIVLSACAAAKGIAFLQAHAAILSLLVAIGTTIDTWLQPGTRYKGHYTYNDKFRELRSDLHFVKRDDTAGLTLINTAWKVLHDEYRKSVLPA